eukprot:710355_1
MSPSLLIAFLIFAGIITFCLCKNVILPWCRTAKRRELLSKKKYKKLTADSCQSVVATYDDDDDDDVNIDAQNRMILKRVEYSSRELEQLKLLDAAIDDEDDILDSDSDSLNFPENDNMELTDEYMSLEEVNSIILNENPHKIDINKPQKSIFENDTEDEHINNKLIRVTTQLNDTK